MLATKVMGKILRRTTLTNFFKSSKEFAFLSGLAPDRVMQRSTDAENVGALGVAQNMVGEAVHAAIAEEHLLDVKYVFEDNLLDEYVVVSSINFQGVRLLE